MMLFALLLQRKQKKQKLPNRC